MTRFLHCRNRSVSHTGSVSLSIHITHYDALSVTAVTAEVSLCHRGVSLMHAHNTGPLMSDRAAIVLHDTNMPASLSYEVKDGSTGESWDNDRGPQ